MWHDSCVARQRGSVATVVVAALVGLGIVLALLWSGSTDTDNTTAGDATTANELVESRNGLPSLEATTDLPTVSVADLPTQAVQTLQLIAAGGPYPYSRDGVVFNNREGILPSQPNGFYREYTVITPGADNRGARRIVAADDGGRFYTDDHYDSFREVVNP